jgi:hypothetical protein
MSDEDEIGLTMTGNEEMRLCGLTGDDEDDLVGDAEELFGRRSSEELFEGSVAHPHPVDDDVAPIQGDDPLPGGDAGAADASSSRPKRPSTSPCWEDFEKLFKKVNGKDVRYGARCLHCRKEYTGYSKFGTGHLLRHMEVCEKKKEKSRLT